MKILNQSVKMGLLVGLCCAGFAVPVLADESIESLCKEKFDDFDDVQECVTKCTKPENRNLSIKDCVEKLNLE